MDKSIFKAAIACTYCSAVWLVRHCGRCLIKLHEKLKRASNLRIPLNRLKGVQRSLTLIGYTAC